MRTDPHRRSGVRRASLRISLARTFALAATLLALPPTGSAFAAVGPALTVDVARDRHAISPEIYGMSYADPTLATELRLPVNRWGGNYTDRYNWRIDTWNTGSDWFFENITGCWPGCANNPPADPSQGYRRIVDENRATGAQTLLTLPMVGWVAKQPGYEHPLPCSFPRSAHPAQQRWDADWIPPGASACGNGLKLDGSVLSGNDPNIASTPSTAKLSGDWIADIKSRYGARAIRWYGLGNEPALWSSTHRDVHPDGASYDEIAEKSVALALAAKHADPHGQTLGFSEWGWPNYFCSAADGAPEHYCDEFAGADRPDRAAHGGQPLVRWFVERMEAESERYGCRLLDYLDLHYYAQGGDSPAVTRSLWDGSYIDPSWIGRPIALLPRMRDWAALYPGTKLALSEYDLSRGGDEPTLDQKVTDTLIQADTLGILAREGVDLAARWSPPAADDFEANAFRVFRNYDGAGGRFGETWVSSSSGDRGLLALYSATRNSDGALTMVIVNKSEQERTTSFAALGLDTRSARAWRWSGLSPQSRPTAIADIEFDRSITTTTFPARSLTVVEVPNAVAPGSGVPPAADPPAAACAGGEAPGPDPVDPGPDPVDPAPGPDPGPGPNGGDQRPPGTPPAPYPPSSAPRSLPPLPLADRVGLPANRRCVRAATVRFTLRSPTAGRRIASASIALGGRRPRTLRGAALRRPVVLTGLPRSGAFTVKVRLRLVGERRAAVAHRRYQRCR